MRPVAKSDPDEACRKEFVKPFTILTGIKPPLRAA